MFHVLMCSIGILAIEMHPFTPRERDKTNMVRMRVIFYAEPSAAFIASGGMPKSVPDFESVGACWVSVKDMESGLKLRGLEPLVWSRYRFIPLSTFLTIGVTIIVIRYLENNGAVYPLGILQERPLLVRHSSKKFDIRQWLLLTDTNPMVLYGFSECYARLSARDYDIRGDENLSDASMHLCNHSIQKHAIISKLQTGDGVNDIEKAGKDADADTFCETMMTQAQLERELAAHTNGISTPFQTFIVPQIQRIAVDVVDCVKDTLFKRGKGFEWLGIDLMIAGAGTPGEAEAENPWKVLLLEVNVSPDISYSTPVTTRLIPPAVKGMFDIVFADSRERTSIDDDAAASSLKWNKWHTGPILDYLQMRNFSKSKTAVCELKGSGSVKPSGSKSGSAGIGSKKSESAERSDRLQAAVISTLKIPAPSMSGHSAAECHETVRLHAAIGMADADLITQGNPGNLPRHGEVAQVAQSHACISDDEDEI
jgi:hypothetical protein